MDPGTLASRLFGVAIVASGRPVAAAFGVQVLVAIAIHSGDGGLPAPLAWTVSPLALGVGLMAVFVEAMVQHTDGADEILRELHADKLVAAVAGLPAMAMLALLTSVTGGVQRHAVTELVASGVPAAEAQALVDRASELVVERVEADHGAAPVTVSAETADVARAVAIIEASQARGAGKVFLFAAALALQFAMTWVRGEIKELAEELELEQLWAWLETGGVTVGVVLLVLAPAVMLLFAIGLVVMSVGALLTVRLGRIALDAARRRPCPACAARIRIEACRCPKCKAEVAPTRTLGEPVSGGAGLIPAAHSFGASSS